MALDPGMILIAIIVVVLFVLFVRRSDGCGCASERFSTPAEMAAANVVNKAMVCPKIPRVQDALTAVNLLECLEDCEDTGFCQAYCRQACNKKHPNDARCISNTILVSTEQNCCANCKNCPHKDTCNSACNQTFGVVC